MEFSSLQELISYLEYGTKLHIGVLFFGKYGSGLLSLPHMQTIHHSPVCDEIKSYPGDFKRCFRCRNAAIKKAMKTKKPFGGYCINGIYEYTMPIIIDGNMAGMIFVGNILDTAHQDRIKNSLAGREDLLETMESDFLPENCHRLASLVYSYIKMLMPYENSHKGEKYNPLVENLKNSVEANLEYDIEIKYLAKIFHYNEKYLGRLFKNETGMRFKEYINDRRLERAGELLRKSNDTIIAISARVGYNNVAYFNNMFRRCYGLTPTEYRHQYYQKIK